MGKETGPEQRGEILTLYARVYEILARRPDETDLSAIPSPEVATERDALAVFRRINSGDLERFYPEPFEGRRLGEVLRAWLL